MKIYDLKVNGMENPIGYAFEDIVLSWKVSDTREKYLKKAKITIAYDKEMREVAAELEGILLSNAQVVKIEKKPRTTYYAQVYAEGRDGESASSEIVTFETGKMEEKWQAKWIGQEEKDTFHPIFEKKLDLHGEIARARLYICGLGLYEAYLDGKKIGENCLTPFINAYSLALQAQAYDVTAMLPESNGELTVALGNGWYKGRLGYDGKESIYGDRFALIAELHLEYRDGRCEIIGTDESWCYYGSDTEYSDIYDGEGINRLLYEGRVNPKKAAVLLKEAPGKLSDCRSIPLKAMEEIQVVEIITTPAGETVLDFGQNFAGYVAFQADFPKGTRILLEHGEILQQGNFYHDNYRTAKTEVTYVSHGKKEWVHPRFTYMGFRYVKVSGWPYEVKKEDFKGVVLYSSMERTGYLETGHAKVNKLISNAAWGMKSNFLDMPTDCPQRDERLGWTGDAQVFAPTASFFMDTKAFYRKFLWDMRNDQILRDGAIANYLPNICHTTDGSSVWGDAAVFIPDTLYWTFGDISLLKENYPLMKDWVDWIRRGDERRPNGPRYLFDYGFAFGDWLAMDGITPQSFKGGTEDAYISSVYYYASVKKVANAAKVLEEQEDANFYNELAEKIRAAILEEYFAPSGRLVIDTQAGYIIALYFGVFRNREVLVRDLRKRLKKDGYRIKCGFVGAPLICETLAANGMEDLAFHMLLQEEFPGWLHCVNLGATTIWERWNSILDDGSISGTGMNSLNHYAYGSVVNYIGRYVAGLQPAEPGYRSVNITPQLDVRLGYMKCTYESASGRYVADWKINKDGTVSVHYEIPFNCTARVSLPGYSKELTLESGVTDITYRPERDYRRLYTEDTLLEDFAKDERALKILKEELPVAYGMALSGDIENLGLTLNEMKYMSFMGLFEPDVERAAKRLLELQKKM